MRPILTQALANVARRRLQTIVVFLIAAMATSVGAMSATLLVQSSSPYDRAFAELSAPHLLVYFDGAKITREQVAATASVPGVTRSAGPWLATNVPFEMGGDKFVLRVLGRDQAGGPLDREELAAGHWVEAPDEIVVTRATAIHHRLSVGDHITALGTPAKPVLTLVGEAIEVDPSPNRGWVLSSQVASLNPVGTPVGYEMAYRFRSATTRADIRSDLNALQATVPAGAVAGHASYLDFRGSFNFTNSLVLTFLLAFAAMGLGAVAVIVANVVTGAVVASYREIGILKAIGFTPGQVVMVFVIQMILPGLAAGLVGVPLGALASKPLLGQAAEAIGLPAPSAIVPGVDLLVLAVTLAVVAAAAALPAWRAGGLNPVVAITTGTAPSGRWSASLHGRLGWWRLPRPLVIGAGDAFSRPLRGVLTAIAILVGVATLVFASGLHSAIARFNDLFGPALNGPYQVSVARLGSYSDAATMEILERQPETRLVVGSRQLQVAVPGEPDPVAATVYRGDSARLGYHIASGR